MFEEWYNEDLIHLLEHVDEYDDLHLLWELEVLHNYVNQLTAGMNAYRFKYRIGDNNRLDYDYFISKFPDPVDFTELFPNIRKIANEEQVPFLGISASSLSHDELVALISYYFWSRGGTLHLQAARSGQLLSCLTRLKWLEENWKV